jgi:hypothetical protein
MDINTEFQVKKNRVLYDTPWPLNNQLAVDDAHLHVISRSMKGKRTRKIGQVKDMFQAIMTAGDPDEAERLLGRKRKKRAAKQKKSADEVKSGKKKHKKGEDEGPGPSGSDDIDEMLKVKPLESRKDEDKIAPMPYAEVVGQHPFRMVISGESQSGKTTLLAHLHDKFYKRYFHEIFCFSRTKDVDPLWKEMEVNPENLLDHWDPSKIIAKADENAKIIKKAGKGAAKRYLIIIDDFAAMYNVMHNVTILDIFMYWRHLGFSCIVLEQAWNALMKKAREQVTNANLFHSHNKAEQESIAEELVSTQLTKKQFLEMYTDFTTKEPYSFMRVNFQLKDKSQWYGRNLNEFYTIGSDGKDKLEKKKTEEETKKLDGKGKDHSEKTGELDDMDTQKNINPELRAYISTQASGARQIGQRGPNSFAPEFYGKPIM